MIKITLKKVGAGLILMVRDNGKGFTENKSNENSSFGLLLMTGLADQLNGQLERQYDGGTVVRVHFKSLARPSDFPDKPVTKIDPA